MKISEVQTQAPDFCKTRCCAGRTGTCTAYVDNPNLDCIYPDIRRELQKWDMETAWGQKQKSEITRRRHENRN